MVLANGTVEGKELIDELHSIDRAGKATYWVCLPANPIDTGQAMHQELCTCGSAPRRPPRNASTAPCRPSARTDSTPRGARRLPTLAGLAAAVETFKPDQFVISTLPEADSACLRYDVLDRAREAYPAIPVIHIVVQPEPRSPVSRPDRSTSELGQNRQEGSE
jgi:GABA permease